MLRLAELDVDQNVHRDYPDLERIAQAFCEYIDSLSGELPVQGRADVCQLAVRSKMIAIYRSRDGDDRVIRDLAAYCRKMLADWRRSEEPVSRDKVRAMVAEARNGRRAAPRSDPAHVRGVIGLTLK
jgi:hypothetical protein